jgi:hypothetical protein
LLLSAGTVPAPLVAPALSFPVPAPTLALGVPLLPTPPDVVTTVPLSAAPLLPVTPEAVVSLPPPVVATAPLDAPAASTDASEVPDAPVLPAADPLELPPPAPFNEASPGGPVPMSRLSRPPSRGVNVNST